MPADEVAPGTGAEGARVSTGPRHAAPRKPLFTRFQVPAGKAIALAAMPTAVLMGMGFTPRLALAEDQPVSLGLTADELTADEYAACLSALENAGTATEGPTEPAEEPTEPVEGATEEPAGDGLSASPSASETSPAPAPPEAPDGGSGDPRSADGGEDPPGDAPSPDSGSDDRAEPTPSPTPPGGSSPSPSPAQSGGRGGGLLDTVGDVIDGVVDGIADGLTGGGEDDPASPGPTPPPSGGTDEDDQPGDPAGPQDDGPGDDDSGDDSGENDSGTDDSRTTPGGDPTEPTGEPAEDSTEPADEPPEEPTASPSPTPTPSASAGVDLDDCPLATDAEGGVDNPIPVPDDPWYLNASSLLLKGADYQGVVEVETASGTRKKVLKYVVSGGTDIGDLHQTVRDEQVGATYHVQAAEGSTSTIRDGDTVMYTEKISGNLLGLIPVEFSPENPPPLNIPLLYFTEVTVVQAAQFGGDLHIPGMQMYTTPD